MSASVQFFDSDGATQITAFDFGDIDGGEHIRPKKFGVKSTSDRVLNAVNQLLEAIAGNDGIDMVSHAADTVTLGPPYGPSTVAPQATLSAAGAGGTFSATGLYGWKITWLNAIGETVGSSEVTVNVDDTTKTVTLLWNTPPASATGAKVYRTNVPGTYSGTNLVATLGAVNTYIDTGTAATTGAPPLVNTTAGLLVAAVLSAPGAGGTWAVATTYFWRVVGYDSDETELANSIEVSVNVNDTTKTVSLSWPTITGASSVRVFRSTTTGVYTSPALVVVLGGGATAYVDTGTVTVAGTLTSTPSYGIPPTVFATGAISEGNIAIGQWYFIWVLIDVPINTPEVGNPRLAFETAQET
jgi:hypothetical protein